MGNDESKKWIFDNVLFLDPNAPPFVSQEEYENRKTAKEAGEDVYDDGQMVDSGGGNGDNKKPRGGFKRFTPGQTKLRTRIFRVMIDISGKSSEFQLKCSNDPMAFLILDRQGQPLRAIPTDLLQTIQRKGAGVICKFGAPGAHSRCGVTQEPIRMTFNFFDVNDCTAFVDTVKLLYGIYVEEYGVTRKTESKETKKAVAPLTRNSCAIHGLVPCHCGKGGRPRAGPTPKEGDEEEDAKRSNDYPITISGKLETGVTLRWSEASALGQSQPPKAVEWRVSCLPGRDSEFEILDNSAEGSKQVKGAQEWNLSIGDTLLLTDSMVGKCVQVKVIRRVKEASERLPFVYSVSMKGPITLDDQGAREVLEIVTRPKYKTHIDMKPEDIALLFPEYQDRAEQAGTQQPYLEGTLTVTRKGIVIDIPVLEAEAPSELLWNYFYMSRLDASQSDLGNEEDLYLQIHLKRSHKKHVVLRIATQSERVRNSLYHAIYFFKLQKSFKGFDRWIQDYERGNFAVFKQRYAKLWAAVSFYDDIVDATELYLTAVPKEQEEPVDANEAIEETEGTGRDWSYSSYAQPS